MTRTAPLLTRAEVAAQLQVSPRTVARYVAAGALAAYHLPGGLRFLAADVDAYLATLRQEAAPVPREARPVPEPVYDDHPRIRPELVTVRGRRRTG